MRVARIDAESLLSNERKDEIAQIYLQFANGYFEPNDKNKQPDYAKAQAFFAKAIEVAPESKQRPETELKIAQGGLTFQGVRFAYNDVPALNGLDLEVEPGEFVVLRDTNPAFSRAIVQAVSKARMSPSAWASSVLSRGCSSSRS